MLQLKVIFKILLILSTILACQVEQSAESSLREFVNYRFSENQTKDYFLENSTGKLHSFYQNMSDDEFIKYSDVSRYKKRNIKILLKKCGDEKCSITYTTSYIVDQNKESNFAAEVKKIAEIEKVDGYWKVADIFNVKTYYDAKEPITP